LIRSLIKDKKIKRSKKSKLAFCEQPYEAANEESSDIGGISTSFHTLNYLTEGHQTMSKD
jgi:hypothetical protein